MSSTQDRDRRVLASSWYARMLGGGLVDLETALAELPQPAAAIVRRVPPLRGLAIWALARRADGLVLKRGERGALAALAASSWLGRRPIVLLELAVRPPSRSRWRRALRELWRRFVERPALGTVTAVQTATAAERQLCSEAYGIPIDRIQHVPWAWCIEGHGRAPEERHGGVVSSGRASCDWRTLFAAASGRSWPLTVICGRSDLPTVNALNAANRARVLCEIPRDQHHAILRSAEVYVVPLADDPGSAGQVRLAAATEAGAPVVASAVPALDGYALPGETAILVPPRDAPALRDAVERLLGDPGEGKRLATAALERARAWTYPDYFAAIRDLVDAALGGRPIPARAPSAPADAA